MRRVHVIGTGGTIVSRRADESSGAVASDSIDDLVAAATSDVTVTTSEVFRTGSYRLGLRELRLVAEDVVRKAAEVDGVVVTHGTDTMEETAYLTDLVHGGPQPVVFTGAQRAADEPDTDGPRNLSQAIEAAADPALAGVGTTIGFSGQLLAARGARKVETLAPDAMGGTVCLAVRGNNGWMPRALPVRRNPLPVPSERFDTLRVEIFVAYPGSDPRFLRRAIDKGVDGIVLAGTGAGNAGEGYLALVEECVSRSIPFVLSTRVPNGPVAGIYGNGGGADLLKAGAISAGVLNPFQARILLALLLDQGPPDSLAETFAKYAN